MITAVLLHTSVHIQIILYIETITKVVILKKLVYLFKSDMKIVCMIFSVVLRRWAGKTSYVHLAPEHDFTVKQKRRPE